MGYGFALSDVTEWTCLENVVDQNVKFHGDISHSLPNLNVSPGPFVRDYTPLNKLGRLQKEFVAGKISYLIGILPGHSTILSWGPNGFRMSSGDVVTIKDFDLVYEGCLAIVDRRAGRRIWELWIEGGPSDGTLQFKENGNLYLESKEGLKNLLPHLPRVRPDDPNRDPRANRTETKIIFSHTTPQFQIAPSPNPSGIILYASTTDVAMSRQFKAGHFVLRPQAPTGDCRLIMYTVSPYAQWVVLLSRRPGSQMGFELNENKPFHDLVRWGGNGQGRVADDRWEVVWTTDNQPIPQPDFTVDKGPWLAFQADGNIVSGSTHGILNS